jgi:branched-chain amino acid transport system permease protein
VVSAAVFAVCWRMGESPWGRVLRAIRDDELATLALGKNVPAYKAAVFAITAGMAGLAGVLLFYFDQLASPDVYSFNVSLAIFSMVIFGGVGNLRGSVAGAAVLVLLQPLLQKAVQVDPGKSFLVQLVIYGTGLVLMMRLRPRGMIPEGASMLAAVRSRHRAAPTAEEGERGSGPARSALTVATTAADGPRPPPAKPQPGVIVLEVRGLGKRFGGIVAADALDLDLARGQITALVGPNGAGKTTVFNLLTGAIRPDAGSIRLNGTELRGKRPDQVTRLGMARSFQDVRIFPRLSVLGNAMLGVHHPAAAAWRWPVYTSGGEHLADLFLRPRYSARLERQARDEAMRWLELTGLAGQAAVLAGSLAYGQQKLLSLARLLATGAEVMLLDEPASGIDARWLDSMLELVASLRGRGKTVCIVEHSLHVVEQLADTVCFMELGRITARGPIRELTSDPRLAESYFGTV